MSNVTARAVSVCPGSVGERRTNRCRRIVAGLACLLLTWFAFCAISPQYARSASAVTEVTSYTVRPGDTLWGYAERITPQGGDVSLRVEELMRLNDLDSAVLQAGQRIVVPVEQ